MRQHRHTHAEKDMKGQGASEGRSRQQKGTRQPAPRQQRAPTPKLLSNTAIQKQMTGITRFRQAGAIAVECITKG